MTMRILPLASLLLLAGCQSLRIGSPAFTRYPPMITCIVVVNADVDATIAKAAIDACEQAATATTPKKP